MYLCTRRKIWTSFSCLVLLKWYHVVFSQFKFPANLTQLVVSKMHCLYANAVMQPSVQHCPCYMAWKTKVHSWCRHCYLCINALLWREKRWLQGLFDPPSYVHLQAISLEWRPRQLILYFRTNIASARYVSSPTRGIFFEAQTDLSQRNIVNISSSFHSQALTFNDRWLQWQYSIWFWSVTKPWYLNISFQELFNHFHKGFAGNKIIKSSMWWQRSAASFTRCWV